MKTPRTFHQTVAVHTIALLALAGSTLLSGCATDSSLLGSGTNITVSDKTRMTKSGYLSDYARLKQTPWSDGIECWRDPEFNAKNYDKVLISRIVISLAPPKDKDGQGYSTTDRSWRPHALLSGCATDSSLLGSGTNITVSDKTRMTKIGYLSDYARLKQTPWSDGIECWRDPEFNAKNYDKVLISRIVISLAPPKDKDAQQLIDPGDLKTLTDYFHGSLSKALKPKMQVVDTPGPGVVVIGIALTSLVPTTVSKSVTGTLIPYAFIAEAGSGVASGRPAGSTPYMGETGMEMAFRDGTSGAVLGECRDTEIGRKYAADASSNAVGTVQTWTGGYVNSFQAWSYAKNAFDKWSMLVAKRLADLRGANLAQ
jgi:hypothetical protein